MRRKDDILIFTVSALTYIFLYVARNEREAPVTKWTTAHPLKGVRVPDDRYLTWWAAVTIAFIHYSGTLEPDATSYPRHSVSYPWWCALSSPILST